MKRRYIHDCSSCKFLGEHREFDLYFCDVGRGTGWVGLGMPAVIARYGHQPHAFHYHFTRPSEELIEALRRAKVEGYI